MPNNSKLRVPPERLPHNIPCEYDTDKLISQQQILDMLGDIRAYVQDVYAKMSNEEYLAEDEKGSAPVGRIMYTIAHTRHHYGQLDQILRDNGLKAPEWYPLRKS